MGLNNFPTAKNTVIKRANKENWQYRQRSGRGGGKEYALDSLPEAVQAEIQIKLAKEAAKKQLPPKHTQVKAHAGNYLPEVIWAPWEKTTAKQREKAKAKVAACFALDDLHHNGMPLMDALDKVSADCGVSIGSLKRWYYQVRNFARSDWMPLLLGHYHESQKRTAHFSPEAWEAFKADYFRPERPQFGTCYERLCRLADENGWKIPSSSSVKRKIAREIPKAQQILLRDGEHALSQLYPSLQRSVAELEAMEWVNGDGYQHNVFVRWHNGDIVRPKTWLWQDVRTRKILAYRTDLSENSDTIRLALMDVVSKYGIPRTLTIDNTRAAANKWMTGGVKNRYRFKVKEDDPMGIIPLLGIDLKWTSVQFGKGHGQAKPVERAFSHGGLGETVDKHPLLAGHYAGENVLSKPDNYHGGKDGASYADFITALEAGIALWNNREGRDTEICQKVYSFNQVFKRDYAD
ncbi:MAG: DDE endonuclease, partial [Gammaproteobacteria bacterium]